MSIGRLWGLAFSVCLLTGCGESSDSPFGVVREAYLAANRGEYDKAQSYISREVREGAKPADMKGTWEVVTHKGSIKKIEKKSSSEKEERGGKVAQVEIQIFFQDGREETETLYLLKQKGEWKIR